MPLDNRMTAGSAVLLILHLIEEKDRYGYEIIEELRHRSNGLFSMKAGAIYPILHDLEVKQYISAYEFVEKNRIRKYYTITKEGKKLLSQKTEDWNTFASTVQTILKGGTCHASHFTTMA